jgi:hypothetical protein
MQGRSPAPKSTLTTASLAVLACLLCVSPVRGTSCVGTPQLVTSRLVVHAFRLEGRTLLPLAQAEVRVLRSRNDSTSLVTSGYTDKDGLLQLPDLPPGEYLLGIDYEMHYPSIHSLRVLRKGVVRVLATALTELCPYSCIIAPGSDAGVRAQRCLEARRVPQ